MNSIYELTTSASPAFKMFPNAPTVSAAGVFLSGECAYRHLTFGTFNLSKLSFELRRMFTLDNGPPSFSRPSELERPPGGNISTLVSRTRPEFPMPASPRRVSDLPGLADG